jgi:dienelactone hydrolase
MAVMIRVSSTWWVFVAWLSVSASAVAYGQPPDAAAFAQTTIDRLVAGNFAAVVATFDDKMRAVLPEDKLRLTWTAVLAQTGAFVRRTDTRVEAKGPYRIALVTCEFAQARADVQVVVDAAGRIAGFFIRPAASTTAFVDAPYVDRASFTERDVSVDAGGWPLPGTLTLPNGGGPWPAVVLVHGSGPGDRDASLGPNKPFRDLAHGLASRGVAALRYDKRTLVHGPKVAALRNFTVKEETVDDAVAAAALLGKTAGIDASRVFVAGHSLGGMVAPRIGAAAGRGVRGLVIMAGAVRSLEQSIIDQTRYLSLLDGTISAEEQRQLDEYQQMAVRIAALTSPSDPPVATGLFSAPSSYFLDLRGYDPPAVAAKLSMPMLIIQGGRDYQVTLDDFAKWKAALKGRKDVTFADFPLGNHLFMTGTGRSSPSEYTAVAGHVSEDVIRTIADWVRAR